MDSSIDWIYKEWQSDIDREAMHRMDVIIKKGIKMLLSSSFLVKYLRTSKYIIQPSAVLFSLKFLPHSIREEWW